MALNGQWKTIIEGEPLILKINNDKVKTNNINIYFNITQTPPYKFIEGSMNNWNRFSIRSEEEEAIKTKLNKINEMSVQNNIIKITFSDGDVKYCYPHHVEETNVSPLRRARQALEQQYRQQRQD